MSIFLVADLLFRVNLNWLIDTINSDSHFISNECNFRKIETLTDFLDWTVTYTHLEGEHILHKAINDGKLLDKPIIKNCTYCQDNNTFALNNLNEMS